MTVVRHTDQARPVGRRLRDVRTIQGLPGLPALEQEFDEYVAILAGDKDAPVDAGPLTFMEISDAYHARARTVEALIYRGERNGRIPKNSPYYKFRTGELQSYISLFRNATELGGRRMTFEKMASEGKI